MASIKDVFVIMALTVAGFGVMLGFVNNMAIDNGATTNQVVNQSYTAVLEQNQQFDAIRTSLENASSAISEAQFGDFAYFGIKGMVTIMTTPIAIINSARFAIDAVALTFTSYVPQELINGAKGLVLIIIIFLVVRFITSRGQEP